ncbi:ATP-dependent zinc metalloprotease FtsH [Megalodesulfovibrio gigas]|uniref:ATP-dependent zinc metalloprotease FtsH n=1 Tax=Megalodesulfovibrio gigas (strain ATCC 19364 / DSM 1382 / NCIMB 9332 / VKM B-1759) TaxID=1121448 RepID=T2G9D2_MEGG1|nr:ATP-dependent zinc metalloprotease FtsH [Megalodesulfovibrio gigas]AGW12517.1 putative ATP-dependent metalloprotease FtsH [Megalodesulfovibrio gigas DSM 1382 = ATCC 19364]
MPPRSTPSAPTSKKAPAGKERPREKKSPLNTKVTFSIWYVLLAIWGVYLLQYGISHYYGPKRIPYSEFLQALNENRVLEVAITQDAIEGRMHPRHSGQPPAENATEPAKPETIIFSTVRVETDLSQQLAKFGVKFRGEIESTLWRDVVSWLIPIVVFGVGWFFIIRRMTPGAGMLSMGRSKAKVYMEKSIPTRFADVAGADEAKEELQEIIEFLKNPKVFTRLGGRLPKGVLLVGPPGTGKTLLAKAVAGEARTPFFSLSGSDFMEMLVGVGAARVRDLFQEARDKAPCIIFIDELDAIGKSRGPGGFSGNDEREQTLNQLLVEMDGFDARVGVIIMAATNRPEILDPALLRAGRFDRQVLVDKPDVHGREAILKVHARTVITAPDVDLLQIAQRTPGFSGADLANVTNEAALLAARRKKDAVEMADFEEAVDRVIGGLEKKNRVINPKEKRIVAYHETGHALVAAATPGADPVHKISIIPRGMAALGYTEQRPTDDRYLLSKTELLARIDVLLGGRVAEELVFGDVTTGAHNDLQRASDIARAMVTEYGMGETLGLASFPQRGQSMFLAQEGMGVNPREYSEATAARLDQEVKGILTGREAHVRALLTARTAQLHTIAARLLETEVMGQEEFMRLAESTPTGSIFP